jgi:hypothetical protein
MRGSSARDGRGDEFSRVCFFAKASLAIRYRYLLAEDRFPGPQSCPHLAREIEMSLRRIRQAIARVRESHRSLPHACLEDLARIDKVCQEASWRATHRLRQAASQASWLEAAKLIVAEAHQAIDRIECAGR